MGVDKAEKREKKEKRSDRDGVKKAKKEKKSKLSTETKAAALEDATSEGKMSHGVEANALVVKLSSGENLVKPVGALVPFANPLADEKVTKKVLKSVKKGTGSALYSLKPDA